MTDPLDLPPLLDVEPHVTELLNVSRNTAYLMIKREEIPAVRIGARLLKVPRDRLLRQLGLLEDPPAEEGDVVPLRRHG